VKYRITCLTPTLIGDGNKLSPIDYMVWKEHVNVLDQRRIFRLLAKGPRLEGYLARIGWDGRREPTRATLESVLRAHMTTVPFENLDVLLGRGIRIDLDSIYGKLVTARRGGYCFEHGTLLREALQRLGFQPLAHAARVIQLRPRSEAPLTHMFLTVQMEGKRLVLDPGFGGHAPRVPVPLTGEEVREGDDVHRMVQQGGDWALEARIDSFLESRGYRAPADIGSVRPQPTPQSPAAFVCEDDVRAALKAGRKVVIDEKTIVTPSARDLGEAQKVFVEAGWPR